MSAETRIYKIEEGSLIMIPHRMSDDQLQDLAEQLIEVAGHDRFVVMLEPADAQVEVYGPQDIIDGLAELGIVN